MKFRLINLFALIFAFVAVFSVGAAAVDTSEGGEETTTQQLTVQAPEITSLKVSVDSVEIEWNEVSGAAFYRVLRKTADTPFTEIGDTDANFYKDTAVQSGVEYTYALMALDSGLNPVSDCGREETVTFIKAPVITKFANTKTGTKITWTTSEGAAKYRLLYLNSKGVWTKLTDTASGSFTHDKLRAGTKYTYTVKCLDEKGKIIGCFYEEGKSNIFLVSPDITALSNVYGGVKISWAKQSGAASYRIARKLGSGDWKEVGRTDKASFVDETAVSGKKYYYTVRCLDKDGNLVSVYKSSKSIVYVKSPVITKFSNTASGTKITWTKCDGASKYRISYLDAKGKWVKLAELKTNTYTHNNLKSGTKYTYTVRCVGSDGKLISGYNSKGFSNVFLKAPVISSLTNVDGGIRVKWGKLSGAASYCVYRKTAKTQWTEIGRTKGTSLVDERVVSGEKYFYTVRCLDEKGKNASVYNDGKSKVYVKTPVITKFSNTASGTKITWAKCDGASKYRVFYLDSENKWIKLADTASTSYIHGGLKGGKNYTYTVRCLSKDGKVISGINSGRINRFIAPVKIASVSLVNKKTVVEWNAVKWADSYRVYRKTLGGSWEKLSDVKDTSFTDTTASAKTVYSYTVRCLDEKGGLISYYRDNALYYRNGKLADGKFTVGEDVYRLKNGVRSGLQTVGGKKYYYDAKGNLKKNGIVGSDTDGWYYANKNGVIDFNYVNGIVYNGSNWIVSNGKAKKAKTKAEITLFRAAKEVYKATNTTMTKSQKLRACFDYAKKTYREFNPRIPHYTGMDWPIVYANDMFVGGGGNCFSYAAAFAFMAKAIGYEEVYCCNSGGHGWAEIDGLIYDPEWSRHHSNYTYFGLDYDKIKNPNYKGAIAAGYPWMHIKI